jgi:hypothetical protein
MIDTRVFGRLCNKHWLVANSRSHTTKKGKSVPIRVGNVLVPNGDILVPIAAQEFSLVSVVIFPIAFEHTVSAAQCAFDRRSVLHE